jgi:hypothetical protein
MSDAENVFITNRECLSIRSALNSERTIESKVVLSGFVIITCYIINDDDIIDFQVMILICNNPDCICWVRICTGANESWVTIKVVFTRSDVISRICCDRNISLVEITSSSYVNSARILKGKSTYRVSSVVKIFWNNITKFVDLFLNTEISESPVILLR